MVGLAVIVLCNLPSNPALQVTPRASSRDRAGLERLLRYCARPAFALERLEQVREQEFVYRLPRPQPDGTTQLRLTPLELIDRLAALIPPPRRHRHRYHGVLAPHSPLRAQVTAWARQAASPASPKRTAPSAPERSARSPARLLWAMLLARVFELLPLQCPHCGGEVRIIAFITEAPCVRAILVSLGEPTTPPKVAPARGPPAGEEAFERVLEGALAPAPAVGIEMQRAQRYRESP
ncbi:MAG: transposase [Burkholderiales bacterium]